MRTALELDWETARVQPRSGGGWVVCAGRSYWHVDEAVDAPMAQLAERLRALGITGIRVTETPKLEPAQIRELVEAGLELRLSPFDAEMGDGVVGVLAALGQRDIAAWWAAAKPAGLEAGERRAAVVAEREREEQLAALQSREEGAAPQIKHRRGMRL